MKKWTDIEKRQVGNKEIRVCEEGVRVTRGDEKFKYTLHLTWDELAKLKTYAEAKKRRIKLAPLFYPLNVLNDAGYDYTKNCGFNFVEAEKHFDEILKSSLPEHYRKAIELYYRDGETLKDIAPEVGVTTRQGVHTIISRALVYLKRYDIAKRLKELETSSTTNDSE